MSGPEGPWPRAALQWRHALASLAQHRLRSALSALGVACGVASFVVMIGAGEGAKRQTLAQIERLGMNNILVQSAALNEDERAAARKLGSPGLTLSDGAHMVLAVPGLRHVGALKEMTLPVRADARDPAPQVLAVNAAYLAVMRLELAAGRSLTEDDERQGAMVCVLGSQCAAHLGQEGRPGASIRVGDALYQVVGVLQRPGRKAQGSAVQARDLDDAMLLPLAAASPPDPALTELVLSFDSVDQVPAAAPVVRRMMLLLHHGAEDTRVLVPQELLEQAARARRTFDLLLGSISLVALFAGGVGIMNIMLATIAERTHEIGLRRALGATRRQIQDQFLAESALLTLAGGALGLGLGLGVVALGSLAMDHAFYLPLWALVAPLLVSAIMGLGFGWYPAAKASRLDPIEALRH